MYKKEKDIKETGLKSKVNDTTRDKILKIYEKK